MPEPISCSAALIHLSPSGSISSGGWVSNGKEQHIYRSSTGLGAHTGACWEPRLPWEQPRVPLWFPLILLYCDIHKMSCLAEGLCHAVFAGSPFKQQNCLPVWLVDFQPLIHHAGILYKIIYCHRNLGKNCWKGGKTRNVQVPDVRGFTHPYSLMRAQVKQAPVVRLHGSGFCICFLFVTVMI